VLTEYSLLHSIHEVDAGKIALVDEFVSIFHLSQLAQFGLHEHDLGFRLSQLAPQHVGLGSLEGGEGVVEGFYGLYALLVSLEVGESGHDWPA
jgi:hypothetical protein